MQNPSPTAAEVEAKRELSLGAPLAPPRAQHTEHPHQGHQGHQGHQMPPRGHRLCSAPLPSTGQRGDGHRLLLVPKQTSPRSSLHRSKLGTPAVWDPDAPQALALLLSIL